MNLSTIQKLTDEEVITEAQKMMMDCTDLLDETIKEDTEDFYLVEDIESTLELNLMNISVGHESDKVEAIEMLRLKLPQKAFIDKLKGN